MAKPIEPTEKLDYEDSKRFVDRMIAVDRGEIDSMPLDVSKMFKKNLSKFLK